MNTHIPDEPKGDEWPSDGGDHYEPEETWEEYRTPTGRKEQRVIRSLFTIACDTAKAQDVAIRAQEEADNQ